MSRVPLVPLLILATALHAAPAGAGLLPRAGSPFRILGATVTAPVEWDGVWNTVDSLYTNCDVGPGTATADVDTICGGETVSEEAGLCALTCNGTATATTIDVTCTGACEVLPGCSANYTMTMQGTRTGDSHRIVSTIQTTYSGSGEGCEFLPPSCVKLVSHGTRTGPAPVEYCLTPTTRPTWGSLKILYR